MLRSDRLTAATDRLSSASDRLSSAVRDHRVTTTIRDHRVTTTIRDHRVTTAVRNNPVTTAISGHRKSLLLVGTALALAGAGSASAATAAGPTVQPAPPVLNASAAGSHDALPGHSSATIAAFFHPTASKQATAKPAAAKLAASPAPQSAPAPLTWGQVRAELNRQTNPVAAAHGQVPFADRLLPVSTAGPQGWMPINQGQVDNATAIVKQALAKRMGVRSAVIAVATAMQESQLVNVNYGTGASLGLFQQQVGYGWGTAAQIMNPSYASNAFLTALQQYQASNPQWAARPLWMAAQGVQKSGFPFAYAKWENQAAQLVRQIAMKLQ